MKYSLRTKLSLSYVFVALFLVAALSIFANIFFDSQFKSYIIKQQDQKNKDIVSLVEKQLKRNAWEKSVIENIGMSALEQGIILKVKDNTGAAVWNATTHNNGMCVSMLQHMAKNMKSRYKNFNGGYTEKSFKIAYGPNKTGIVQIGYYGPYYYSDNDLAFINKLNQIFFAVGVFALLLALVLGAFMAKRLSNPISRVINTSLQIERGNFGARITENSSTTEIGQLTSTINNLADTLEKQETLRKNLTADVAHELRTPLATLQSHMEAMIDGIWKPDTERLTSCHDEIIRLSRLVGDLEKLAKYEGSNIILEKESFDFFDLLKRIIKNFEADIRNKGLSVELQGDVQIIEADRDKISQLIVNIVSNAIKYTSEGGAVSVNVSGNQNEIIFTVRDSGCGISPEDLPFIFERFYRADKSRNRLTGGSGIGLAVVKAVVDAHNGNISVKSELNKGTEFSISIPKN